MVSRDDLIAACWDGRIVSEDAINFVVAQLRKLAQRTGAFRLETIARVGYRLVAEGAPRGAGRVKAGGAPAASRRRALRLAAGAGGGRGRRRRGLGDLAGDAAEGGRPVTIAVLPFDDLAPATQTRFLAVGLAREVRNSLSRIAGLAVIADASSFALSAQRLSDARDRPAAGRRPAAQGQRRAGGRARCGSGAELVDLGVRPAGLGRTQESRGGDLFSLQDQVAGAVIQELITRIGPDRLRAPPALRRRDPEVVPQHAGGRRPAGAEPHPAHGRPRRRGSTTPRTGPGTWSGRALRDRPQRSSARCWCWPALIRNGWTRALAAQPACPGRARGRGGGPASARP